MRIRNTFRSILVALFTLSIVTLALACGGSSGGSPTAPPAPGPTGAPLPTCTIAFDGSCPNAGAQCGATFAGGNGCLVAGLVGCYSTGSRGYEVGAGQTVSVTLDGDLNRLSALFAAAGAGQGEMRFFDATGAEVGSPLTTNGDCSAAMPPDQVLQFDRAVRSIEITATGSAVYVDTFVVN